MSDNMSDTMSDTIVINNTTLSTLRADEYAMLRNRLRDRLEMLKTRGEALEAYLSVIEGRFRAGNTEAAINAQAISVDAATEVVNTLCLVSIDLKEVVEKAKWVGGLKEKEKLGRLIKVRPRT